jgi:hypothetical protein
LHAKANNTMAALITFFILVCIFYLKF